MTAAQPLRISTPEDREFVMTRDFHGKRERVFQALTKPELLKRWMYGPDGWELADCVVDLRVNGAFRYVWRHANGREMAMSGVFREITPPSRLVTTESFEFGCDAQSGEQVVTTVLTESDGITTLTTTVLYPSKDARDAALQSGMQTGLEISYDRMAEIVRTLS